MLPALFDSPEIPWTPLVELTLQDLADRYKHSQHR